MTEVRDPFIYRASVEHTFNAKVDKNMANHKSAKKRIRQTARRYEVNGARRGSVRTAIKKVEAAIAAGDKTAAEVALKEAEPKMARGAQVGIFHRNTMARKVSRLSAGIKALG